MPNDENKTDCLNDLEQVRDIEGFPIGEDEDICNLSNPPHYTAYPNPHIADFIAEHGTVYDEEADDYQREPFLSDVSEGKYNSVYRAHSYHTKVPHKAVIPFIEHYTEPGDLILDGFCGTGMVGIAAQMLGRKVILSDLAPAATFIACNYNLPVDLKAYRREAKRILQEVERECEWMYKTWHPHHAHADRVKARINHTVWSDVFECSYCSTELVFWDAAVDEEEERVKKKFDCPECGAEVTKRQLERASETKYDEVLEAEVKAAKQVPVLINYSVGGTRYEKRPDEADQQVLQRIEQGTVPYWYPVTRIDRDLDLWYERDYRSLGIYSIDSFYFKRSLWCLATFRAKAMKVEDPRLRNRLLWALTAVAEGSSKMNRERPGGMPSKLSGTLYIGALIREIDCLSFIDRKVKKFTKLPQGRDESVIISTQSASHCPEIPSAAVDYIFTDPPFGSNIIYSDLNIIWESWLNVFTAAEEEAVIHRRKKENPGTLKSYRDEMTSAFREMYRILKPSRWITVEFHNTKAAVWTAIQDALARAGFVIAQVAILDKRQGSFKQVTAPGTVKNDLVINAYKPHQAFQEQFLESAGIGQERSFIAELLQILPSTSDVNRTEKMLYSKMLAYYVQHGYEIGMDSAQFYRMLSNEFVERDGFWFLDETQAQEYEQYKFDPDRKQAVEQAQNVLFISDERSAITWLHHFLADGAKSLTEVTNAYFKAPRNIDEDQIPELQQLLEETCVQVNGHWKRPDRLTAEELEARRQERLLRQFDDYLRQARNGQKLEDVRKEAVMAGFTRAYRQKQFRDILTVGRKMDEDLVESSSDLYDFIDIAETKIQA